MDLEKFQTEVAEWHEKQPWSEDDQVAITLGLAEEAGEVARAVLKRHQGIRGTHEEWTDEIWKELGDVLIKCAAIANREGILLEDVIVARWCDVRRRDFTRHPLNGLSA
jgi:NTP pyrophosphatase (non-canonical NTP hydrolase)